MVEVIWVTVFGAALAWLQARSQDPESLEAAKVPVEDEWQRWEDEIFNWRDTG